MPDQIGIEITEDGIIKIKTKDISETNHINADELLEEITEAAGGQRKTEQLEHEFWKTRSVIKNKQGKIKITGGK